ncbi:von Willebrand factor A domain-containing protein 5A-like [Spea bombifrons]|uniref:von Willebrand factor A domain-containing protein 5A-like n=1 Tax=Spea bombifrons TaxID=233779 RepID=UPI00234A0541|nr:von Willebrand factor A domain-containing protein 5A-like [Spea bombifrons]
MAPCCGLVTSAMVPVPLKGISVDVQVKGFVADVSATLKYKNLEENAVEAVFVFPMDDDSAVYSFEATVEGKKIVAEIQEKEQAHKTYDEAVSQGQQAFLLEEDESSGDIFSCSVGNLLPGQEAEVTLCFVRELPVEADGAVRFVLPAVLNPRYTPEGEKHSVTMETPALSVDRIPYTLTMNTHFQSANAISKVESSSAITPLEYTNEDKTAAKVSLAEGHKFDRDVELLVYYADVNKPSVIVETGLPDNEAGSMLAEPVVMLNFYPSFPVTQAQSNCWEFIFVMDRSGSMTCNMNQEPNSPSRIQSAKETLVLLLKSLPLGSYFNVFGFGSTFESFFPESVAYTQESMTESIKRINELEADLGGTEILQPLQKIYKTAVRPEHPRQLFVFTDGEVSNTKGVIAEVRRNSPNHRCFTFGIGEGASTALIKGMAGAGNGTCEFITGNERMQPKVLRTLKCALQPIVREVTLTWTLPPGLEAVTISKAPSAIFQGQRSIVYAQLKGQVDENAEGKASLTYKFKEEVFTNDLELPLKSEKTERPTIHRLAAKALISELEGDADSEEVKKRILETSLQSGVISSLTAYVAIDKESKSLVEGPPVRRDIPHPAMPYMARCMAGPPVPMLDMVIELCEAPSIRERGTCAAAESLDQPGGNAGASEVPEIAVCSIFGPESDSKIPDQPEPGLSSSDPETEQTPAVFRLITLQNADGSWDPSSELASILGVLEDFTENRPEQAVETPVWTTILALLWLHTSGLEQRDEWELLEGKALSWIKSKAGSSLGELVQAGNALLKSSVAPDVFGV